jgi:hypothetical protein
MVQVLSIGETYTTKKGTKRTLVTYQGTTFNLVTGSYNKANGFVEESIAKTLTVGMQLEGNITRVSCTPFKWVNKDGVITESNVTNVIANEGEPYQVLVDRANSNNAFQMAAKGLTTGTPSATIPVNSTAIQNAAATRIAELKAKAKLSNAEKIELMELEED